MDPHSLIENRGKNSFINWRWPELRAYDNLEYEAQISNYHRLPESERDNANPIPVTLDEDISEYDRDPDYFRIYQYFRFFYIIEGFLKMRGLGNLDLTGRHQTRLNELKPLWQAFFNDVFRVKYTARISLVQEEDEDGFLHKQPFYKIRKEDWEDFRRKWKIPRRIDFNSVVKQTERTCQLHVLHSDGPKIQKLCLLDLPTEVLDLILSVASLEYARLLSATNKRLYQLGHPYTFKSLSLGLKTTDFNQIREGLEPQALSLKARTRFLQYSCFLRTRPDLLMTVDELIFRNFGRLFSQTLDGSFTPHILDGKTFLPPITSSLNETIALARNVRVLDLSNLDITCSLMQTLAHLIHLQSIILSYSMQHDDLTRAIIENELPTCGQVQFVELSSYSVDFQQPSDELAWLFLILFPNLLNFHYLSPPRETLWSPPIPSLLSEDSASPLAMFKTLQRLFLSHYADVQFLTDSFQKLSATNSAISFPLTHLKIHTCFGLSDSVVIDLLEALHSGNAALEVLILVGLQNTDLALFENIADFFPNILELSLYRGTSKRQARSSPWRHPTWEYARRFARLTRLRYFSWNLLHLATNLPRSMLVFERQAEIECQLSIVHTPNLDRARLEQVFEEDAELLRLSVKVEKDFYDYNGWNTARLFRVYCPTIEMFSDGCRSWSEVRISGDMFTDVLRGTQARWDPIVPWRLDRPDLRGVPVA
ncbi:hypothetical protein BDP27DRAFT_1402480 [Rhodocollybia butyracea]|uniref:Uncharacterized protein n=1 Tax=Rhodocollybia butyracea TaxID=206335 RepID=A0A9P5PPB4_9AGAR|nr:hypothetical protein BDP27DRAFT_1402480 [Rhodocollybia butyracea]